MCANDPKACTYIFAHGMSIRFSFSWDIYNFSHSSCEGYEQSMLCCFSLFEVKLKTMIGHFFFITKKRRIVVGGCSIL